MIELNSVIGLILGLLIGFICRWFDLPLPAPPKVNIPRQSRGL